MFETLQPLIDEWTAQRADQLLSLKARSDGLSDEWWKRQRRGPAHTGKAVARQGLRSASEGLETPSEMRQRFLRLAGGAQPAVTKVLGFGGGATVTKAAVSYISRNGQLPLENENGTNVLGRKAAGDQINEWGPLFAGADKSNDLALFQIDMTKRDTIPISVEREVERLNNLFGGRSLAVAFENSGSSVKLNGLVVLNLPGKGRLETGPEARAQLEDRLHQLLGNESEPAGLRFGRQGHGVRFAAAELRKLVKRHAGQVVDGNGLPVDSLETATKLAHVDWRSKIQSRAPRDFMHFLVAAQSMLRPQAFEAAVRRFLSTEFGGHRYLFAIHNPLSDPKGQAAGGKRPHLHAHAVIATRSDYGERLTVWITDLNRWRASFAECARSQGLSVEFSHRHETYAARAYRHHDVRPTSTQGRTEHQGTSVFAQRRYDAKRSQRAHIDNSSWAHVQAKLVRQIWKEIADVSSSGQGRQFAKSMLARFDDASRAFLDEKPRPDLTQSAVAAREPIALDADMGFKAAQPTKRRNKEQPMERTEESRRDQGETRSHTKNSTENKPMEPALMLPRTSHLAAALTSALANMAGAARTKHLSHGRSLSILDEQRLNAKTKIESAILKTARADLDRLQAQQGGGHAQEPQMDQMSRGEIAAAEIGTSGPSSRGLKVQHGREDGYGRRPRLGAKHDRDRDKSDDRFFDR